MQCNTEPLKPCALSLYLSVLRLIFSFPMWVTLLLLCESAFLCKKAETDSISWSFGTKARSAGAAAAAESVQPEVFLFDADSANLTAVVSGLIFGLLRGGFCHPCLSAAFRILESTCAWVCGI